MDFRLSTTTTVCIKPVYKLEGDPFAFIAIENKSQKWENNKKSSLPSASLYLAEHFDYYEDQFVNHLNRIQRELSKLDCSIDKGKLERFLLLS